VLHDVSPAEVWRQIRAARWGWLLAAAGVATLGFPLRTIRWRVLLRYEGQPLPWTPLWHATAIGFMANNLLPARAGEVARAYAASRLTSVRFTTAFASIAVERILDGVVLLALLVLGLAAGGFGPSTTIGGVAVRRLTTGAGVVFGGLLVAALVAVAVPGLTRRVARGGAGLLLPARWAPRAMDLIEGVLEGLSALRSPTRVAVVLWWSVVLWLTNALSFWLAFAAFGLALSWGPALVLQGVVAFGVALPSSPGFVGVFEGATRAALALYAISATTAASLAIGYHVCGFIPITLLGLWSLWRANLHLGDLRARAGGPT
jgi:glycosyltransferase 2 family protein